MFRDPTAGEWVVFHRDGINHDARVFQDGHSYLCSLTIEVGGTPVNLFNIPYKALAGDNTEYWDWKQTNE